ncbi:MAG TPA: ATP-grasp domain-containing protein [Arthrobacter sp.]|nr:ATP-grasp domain-containing protein [Arthrobacter sp.]
MKPRVLVTGVGGPAGRAVAAQLAARGIPVIGTDIRELPDVCVVPVVRVPDASDPELVSSLRRLVRTEGINLVIPTVRAELPRLAAFRPGFGPDVRVIIGSPGAVALADDKLYTAWQLHSAGVPIPGFGVPRDFSCAEEAIDILGGPVVVGPRVSHGGGVVLVRGAGDIDWDGLPGGMIVQEFVPGTEYGAMVFGTPAHNTTAPFAIVVERTELTRGGAGDAVGTRRVETGEAIDVGNVAMAAVRALSLTGPVEVDVRRRADGRPVVLGVKAKFGVNSQCAPELLDAVLASFALPSFNPASFRQCRGAFAHVLV